jgi:hypothetical protein
VFTGRALDVRARGDPIRRAVLALIGTALPQTLDMPKKFAE